LVGKSVLVAVLALLSFLAAPPVLAAELPGTQRLISDLQFRAPKVWRSGRLEVAKDPGGLYFAPPFGGTAIVPPDLKALAETRSEAFAYLLLRLAQAGPGNPDAVRNAQAGDTAASIAAAAAGLGAGVAIGERHVYDESNRPWRQDGVRPDPPPDRFGASTNESAAEQARNQERLIVLSRAVAAMEAARICPADLLPVLRRAAGLSAPLVKGAEIATPDYSMARQVLEQARTLQLSTRPCVTEAE
jgi:hypothetical protein